MPRHAKPRIAYARSVAPETIVHSAKSFQPDHVAATTAPRWTRTPTADPGRTIRTDGTGSAAGIGMAGAAGIEMAGAAGIGIAGAAGTGMTGDTGLDKAGGRKHDA